MKLIYQGVKDLTIIKIISKFSTNYKKEKKHMLPVFELKGNEMFPLEETLLPIFKRKVLNIVIQSKKVEKIETIN